MYTRCPECQTAFHVTVAQLKMRDGLVRCGRCDAVFRADLRLFSAPAADGTDETYEEIELAAPPGAIETSTDSPDPDMEIPTVSELTLFLQPTQRQINPAAWIFGILVFSTVLFGQFAFFYRNELAVVPHLRPWLTTYCEWLGCEVIVPTAVMPELVETTIAPHARYANILRVRAAMVNRADSEQPLPLIQLTLTASDGQLLARRTFSAREYLDTPTETSSPMEPNVVVNALLDVTNPDGKASGYEIKLFPAQATDIN